MPRPRLALLLVLGALVVPAVIALTGRDRPTAPSAPRNTDLAPRARAAPLAEKRSLPLTAVPRTARVEPPVPARPGSSAVPAVEEPLPKGIGFLWVEVRSRETDGMLAGVRLAVLLDDEPEGALLVHTDLHRGMETHSLVTDEIGMAGYTLPTGRGFRLRAWSSDRDPEVIERELAPLEPSEHRSVRLEVSTEPDLLFHGRLVSQIGGGPLAGITVFVRQAGRTLRRDLSDREGRFALEADSWRRPYLWISAPGHAPALVPLTTGHETAAEAREIVLAGPTAALLVTVVDPMGIARSITGIRVLTSPRRLARGPSDPAYADVESFTWEPSFRDEEGRIYGLPPGVPLTVVVPGAAKIPPQTLAPGETRELHVGLLARVSLRGRLLDRRRVPVAKKELWLLEATPFEERYIGCGEWPRESSRRVATAADGSFAFSGVLPGNYLMGPCPACPPMGGGFHGTSNVQEVAPLALPVSVFEEMNPLELVLDRELAIIGRVVHEDGSPARLPYDVRVESLDRPGWLEPELRPDGAFEVGPLARGRFQLVAWKRREPLAFASRPRVTRGGAQDLELVLESTDGIPFETGERGTLHGIAFDVPSGEPRGTGVVSLRGVSWLESRQTVSRSARLQPQTGAFEFERLPPGTYTLTLSDRRGFGVTQAVLPSRHGSVVDVELPIAARSQVVVIAPHRASWEVIVESLEGLRTTSFWGEGELLAVPCGPARIKLARGGGFIEAARDIVVTPGAPVVVDFSDDRTD